ncbi:MAG: SUMF1/EgtB/PvdO family nonheme iron enzyme [Fimbriimonadaceae bacterium]|nr:SUMF1/EgtB/PvdO family nonheme iron enzyme [Fimbriimonadaceae bacterium]QYK56832.1 MAG: SUMF1/EgtB/PvdO family nonheme iron enzyme [Fimbriimonadaceae bacterium]
MSPIAVDTRKDALRRKLSEVRQATLDLLDTVPDDFWRRRIHGFYSPIGWHFGHVGRTEEFWACHRAMQWPVADDRLTFLFHDCPENPKDNRVNVPDREGCVAYLEETRASALRALEQADLGADDPLIRAGYAWEFAYQHECQHQETILEMLCLIHQELGSAPQGPAGVEEAGPTGPEFVPVAGGTFVMGTDDPFAYDNEQDPHSVTVAPFEIARRPVTVREWRDFIADGGYKADRYWSSEGVAWREASSVVRPEYWLEDLCHAYGVRGPRELEPDQPVQGVSWFEAEAFANWSGCRLPTEAEWESLWGSARWPWGEQDPTPDRANLRPQAEHPVPPPDGGATTSGVLGLAGGVWEWTSTPFSPYPGFSAFPYEGYSAAHMDGRHRVCRGGSWATSPAIARRTFRNWYVPTYRQGFLGVRLARSTASGG